MQNLPCKNFFDLHLNGPMSKTKSLLGKTDFHLFERFRTWTHFETEAKGTRLTRKCELVSMSHLPQKNVNLIHFEKRIVHVSYASYPRFSDS